MNAIEIEEVVSALAGAPFDAEEFPYQFLAAFGNKETTLNRLRSGNTNKSDVAGGVLQRNNIHIAVCDPGTVGATLPALQESTATASQKAKYILATDGQTVEAESIEDGETLACGFAQLADHIGFFLPLAGITTIKQIRENAFDIKATIYQFFAAVRTDLQLQDRIGESVEPREWFFVPLSAVKKLVEILMDGRIEHCEYDPATVQITDSMSGKPE